MKNPRVIMSKSAMSKQSKVATLSNEVFRRMTNTDRLHSTNERAEIVNVYIQKLATSGYSEKD